MSSYNTTSDAARAIIDVLKQEAGSLGAAFSTEKQSRDKISNETIISLKRDGKTFRISFTWVRDECLSSVGHVLGRGYIETEWDLKLSPEAKIVPRQPPYQWVPCRAIKHASSASLHS